MTKPSWSKPVDYSQADGDHPTDERRLGIGITTYNRQSMLDRTIEAVYRHTNAAFSLVVVDDGSTDDTEALLARRGVAYISAPNRGIAWNKNRALYYLHEVCKCDYIILLEDDTFPVEDYWESAWIDAIRRYGHINLAPAHWTVQFEGGSGLPGDPFLSSFLTGQCVGFSRQALSLVGYMDTRFRHYGFEHIEHTDRFMRAGFGGVIGANHRMQPCLIRSPLVVEGLDKPPDLNGITHNGPIYEQIREEPTHRWAWRTDEEMIFFRTEVASAKLKTASDFPSFFLFDNFSGSICFDSDHGLSSIAEPEPLVQVAVSLEAKWARLCLKSRLDGMIAGWLRVEAQGSWTVGPIEAALKFEIVPGSQKGFGLRYGEHFLCCDFANDRQVTLTRKTMDQWETFMFKGYDYMCLGE